MIRVVVADDHAVVRGGLEQLLGTADDIELVGSAADGEEAVRAVDRELAPDVVLMDLSMPVTRRGRGDPPHRRRRSRRRGSSYSRRSPTTATSPTRCGPVRSATCSSTPGPTSCSARSGPLPRATRRSTRRRPGCCSQPAAAAPGAELSAREEEVLRLVAAGLANKQIARRLGDQPSAR